MSESLLVQVAKKLGPERLLTSFSPEQWAAIQQTWDFWARPEQLEPPGDWLTWIILAGRAWGKSRTGAELVRKWAMEMPGCHIALIGRTAADVRDVMVRALTTAWKGGAIDPRAMPVHEPSNRRLVWPNGSFATTYSAEEPNALRGPQHDRFWGDEPAAWQYPQTTYHEGIKMGLRGGGAQAVGRPRGVMTTTPRSIPFIRELLKAPTSYVTRGSTYDNARNLPESYIADMRDRYEGTRLGRQELHAELLEDIDGALWRHDMIDSARVREIPWGLERVVVAIDPSGSAKKTADEVGIVVAGVKDCDCKGHVERHGFVIEDLSGRFSPRDAITRAIAAYHKYKADRVVAEDNFGGQIIADLVQLVDRNVAYRAVHASRGKIIRAEPIAALYEQHRVHHVGMFADMEDEMTSYAPMVEKREGQLAPSKSPGRLDAVVWALTDLMLGEGMATMGGDFKSPVATFAEPPQQAASVFGEWGDD